MAQDPVDVDPRHDKVEFENDDVRVLRITYGPGEKGVDDQHPASVAVFLTDAQLSVTLPDGKTEDYIVEAGRAQYNPARTHQGENVGDKPFELVEIELKAKPTAAE